MAASVITESTRASTERGSCTILGGRRAGGCSSRGTTSAKSPAQARATRLGTTNAARHPACFTRKPVKMAANAMPRLPKSPLSPMVKPGLRTFCTSIGMPTG
jgi:hypothetical protein